MKIILLGILALSLGGCWVYERPLTVVSDYYTKSDVDAISAETQCKAMAKNLVQVSRCEVRR